jgi:hypothetical protein
MNLKLSNCNSIDANFRNVLAVMLKSFVRSKRAKIL